jgi:hypothetical protein
VHGVSGASLTKGTMYFSMTSKEREGDENVRKLLFPSIFLIFG